MRPDKPFSSLTSDEFLALPETERVAYLQNVTDHLNGRAALLAEPQPLQDKEQV